MSSGIVMQSVAMPREGGPMPVMPACICLRPHGLVLCKSCGWFCPKQRVRRPCAAHPRTLYLMDLTQCPKCFSYPPILMEYPVDDNNNNSIRH